MSLTKKRRVDTTAICFGCDVRDPDAFCQSTSDGKSYDAVRMAARRHAESSGHKVQLHTESVTTYLAATTDKEKGE